MKKYFLTAILSLLVATVFTSCGDNDIIEETEKPSSELKVWVEPYHIKGASLDEVTAYMSVTMMRYHFEAENKTADSFQLAYKTGNGNEAILYSFLRSDSTLYSVIDTELISNSRLFDMQTLLLRHNIKSQITHNSCYDRIFFQLSLFPHIKTTDRH